MKQKLLMLLILLMSGTLFAQIPSYYNDVNLNLTGQNLKDELAVKIIATHSNFLSYTPGVWNALQQADLDPNNSNNVLLIYGYDDNDGDPKTDRIRDKFDNGGGLGLWNREHTYPKSLGNPNLGTSGPGSDAHHLRPSDGQMNSTRSNRKYAAGSGNAAITSQGDFYPGDEWKGDVARMMMYMYLRYGTQCLPSSVGVGNVMAGDSNMIDLFLQWNVDDPVNIFEDNRNNVLAGIQGNRNPFIDNPVLATQIWGGPVAEDRFGMGVSDTEAPSVPLNLVATNTTVNTTMLSWTASTDNIGVTAYNVYQNSSLIATTSTTSYNVSGLVAETSYNFYLRAKDAAGNISANSTVLGVFTLASGTDGNASELFISEYIEGSSNNKALEIANFTGSTVDLSSYTLKKATNGSGSFTSNFVLSGQLDNGEVYVVANSNANSTILVEVDATNGGVMTFNGNDAVGLFKDDVLIDVLGDASSSSNYAKDVTLRRKSSISNPNTLYTTSEWDTYSQDTFDDLGIHTIDGATAPVDTTAPSIPTNVVASTITEISANLAWTASSDNVAVTGYDVYQDGNLLVSVTTTAYVVTGLNASTTYNFAVRARDAEGNMSDLSTSTSVTTETPVDTTAPSTPTNIIASNVSETSVSLSWTASTDNVAVTGYDVYQDGSLLTSVTNTSHNVSGLTASTNYNFSVRAKDAEGNISSSSNIVNLTTDAIVLTYCNSNGNNTNYEYIDFVGLGNISNTTAANGGYGDFTNQIANVNYGSNTILLSIGFPGSSYTENWKVWIDFNQNGTFESSEEVVTGSTSSSGNLSYSFDVPTSALSGNTRMRVSMKWNGAPTACETFSYGEVEDYTVSIGNIARNAVVENLRIDGVLTEEDKVFDVDIYNSFEILNIVMKDDRTVDYMLTNMIGQIVKSGQFENQLKLSNIPLGVYFISISDGRRIISKKFIKQ